MPVMGSINQCFYFFMKPSQIINAAAITLSTFAVYSLWKHLDGIISWIPLLKEFNPAVMGALISLGFYKGIISVTTFFLRKLKFLKKLILGEAYLEGTWIGYYANSDDSIVFYVERITQDVYDETLDISGYANDENNKLHATWDVICSKIDLQNKRLLYMYNVESANKPGTNRGLADIKFIQKENEPPFQMHGVSIDAHNKKKLYSKGKRLTDSLTYDDASALKEARIFYHQNKPD